MQAAAKSAKKLVTRERRKIGLGQIILLLLVLLFTVFCFAPVILVFISVKLNGCCIGSHTRFCIGGFLRDL